MSPRTLLEALLLSLAGSAAACGGSPEEAKDDPCIPNQQISCTCPSGGLGVQECAADGSGFGACSGCQGAVEGCSSEPDCDGCTSCFDSCVCQGGDAKACLKSCAGSSSGGGGSSGGGALDCPSCVAQSCPNELSGCTQTSGCIELVQCAEASGCSLSDYGCLLFGCGVYMINFKAVPAAMSLGGCAAQACAVECS